MNAMLLPIMPVKPHVPPGVTPGPRSIAAVRVLRVSVTDRCNLRCTYCMPAEGLDWIRQQDLLSFEEICEVVRAAAAMGISRIKLTGGEPTVRRGIVELVRRLRGIEGVVELSLTTNGVQLNVLAAALRGAGLDRVTISIDTLRRDRFRQITRNGELRDVLDGLEACEHAGFGHLKINCVAMRGINDDEFANLARLALSRRVTVRFIEYMPLGETGLSHCGAPSDSAFMDEAQIRAAIERELGPLEQIDRASDAGVGPSTIYRFARRSTPGRIGFISAMSAPFCATCNRLRLTAEGRLCSCLFDGGEIDIRNLLRDPRHRSTRLDAIARAMRQCVSFKPEIHSGRGCMQMSRIGG